MFKGTAEINSFVFFFVRVIKFIHILKAIRSPALYHLSRIQSNWLVMKRPDLSERRKTRRTRVDLVQVRQNFLG